MCVTKDAVLEFSQGVFTRLKLQFLWQACTFEAKVPIGPWHEQVVF
jgi:hypothetical protein